MYFYLQVVHLPLLQMPAMLSHVKIYTPTGKMWRYIVMMDSNLLAMILYLVPKMAPGMMIFLSVHQKVWLVFLIL